MTQNSNYYIAIMAGGIGSRFWPFSKTHKPKQFLDILNTGHTLLQSTFNRFTHFIPKENIFIVTSQEYVNLVKEQLPQLDRDNIIAEPMRKNTAPCIAYVSYKIAEKNPNAAILCSPADHNINDTENFKNTCLKGLQYVAQNNNMFTILGIKPTHPNTGYGYVQFVPQDNTNNIFPVKTFTEKPNIDLAKKFLESGEFLWNAGIFISSIKNMIESFEKYAPDLHDVFSAHKNILNTSMEADIITKIYNQCMSLSFDYAVMEKAKNVLVIPCDFGWNDLGTWNSLYDISDKNNNGNVMSTPDKTLLFNTKNTLLKTHKDKVVVIEGLDNMVVVNTEDALLIFHKDKEQEVKQYIEELKKHNLNSYL